MTACRRLLSMLLLATLALPAAWAQAPAAPAGAAPAAPRVVKLRMETSMGNILLELYPDKAPLSVANFVGYAESGFYDGLIFHRVIPFFMIQGGGVDTQFKRRKEKPSIKNESANGLHNQRGTIAMARTSFPHSATSEFFINVVDNINLDRPSFDGWGYTVFGRVTEGMDVVDNISYVPTGSGGEYPTDVPQTPVIIKKLSVLSKP